MVYNKYYKDNKKYYNARMQKKVRGTYKFWENGAKKVAKAAKGKGWWGWQFAPAVARTIDNWRYRRHIYRNKIRTYKVIGSRPSGYRVGSHRQVVGSHRQTVGSRPY